MIIAVVFAVLAQVTPPKQTIVRDSTPTDSARTRQRLQPVRRALTADLLASAYKDSASRALVMKGRLARLRQDSSIMGYDAKVAQRLSVKAAIGSVTMDRLAYRQEAIARVQWQRGIGAHVDVTGGRVSIPALGIPKEERNALESTAADPSLVPIPYFPGQEPLWVGQFAARPDVNENSIINPLANGAEAYYTYSSGEATTIRLGNGDTLAVRQVDVRPRDASPNAIVGSLWLDAVSGQVVRAAYRMAAPGKGNVSVSRPDSVKGSKVGLMVAKTLLKAFVPTMVAEVTDIVVEYQRVHDFWLPRSQVMDGYVKSSFARVPVTMENSFHFESVNETTGLVAFAVDTMSTRMHVVNGDTIRSINQCKTGDTRTVTAYKADSVPVQMRIPCDLDKLLQSPDLPASAFADAEEIFGTAQREELVKQALTLADQGPFRLLRWAPTFEYGVSSTRYNRIEGLSTALTLTEQLGAGFDMRATGRIATADHTPRFDVSLGRSNASQAIRLGGYDRLVPMTDWETPLSFGSSMSALLFGRDNAFYYRATGGELTWTTERGPTLTWRAFRERQHTALQKTDFSIAGSLGPNLPTDEGWYSGAAARYQGSRGLDPRGFRASTDIRLDGAAGDSVFGRAAMELTFLRGLSAAFDGALTLGAGTSVGGVPVQRRWYLGGTQTVRGQDPSPALSGNAFWLTRAELGHPLTFMKVALFGDLGWAGDRSDFTRVGRPASGAGVGFSFFDGAARLDVARGIYPAKQTTVAFYLGSRF